MRKNQTSVTAMGIAIARAVESSKPAPARICYDPYARQFVPAWMYHVLGFFIRSGYAELRGPGVNGFLAARERYIDDVLSGFIAAGIQQLVILGAGFDSRAYRFDLSGRVKTFEVDHPATQADKLEKVRRIFGSVPAHVTYVAVDFNTQSLADRLLSAGFDPARTSLFIWQGVSMYLTPAAVDATLDFVVRNSAPGSAIVFDYLYREALEEAGRQREVGNMRRYRFMTGEGLTFGIPKGTGEAFLLARGFRAARDVNAADLKAAYFRGPNAWRAVVNGYGILLGRV
ncbi:methyltransferase [Longilinea arvoryzae]|uniref:S-adenosyl-L-methionine-dependent methyltransferase n=1 Tax=Longilinea arvoryzae TaxID=360412 RepID=A0A0S7BEQ1_9CHLR|nr:class I SAM-dependent methyltransferase [Longilinea arvoryzae]GAP12995.1 methyltransferase [Longilinea arvoryzae]